jgi:hypothetical protein
MDEGCRLRMQVEFNLLEAEAQFGVSMDGLTVESFELSPGTAVDDLYLVLGHAGRRISGRLEYNAELFKASTARRFAADWQVRLTERPHSVNRPACDVGTCEERRRLAMGIRADTVALLLQTILEGMAAGGKNLRLSDLLGNVGKGEDLPPAATPSLREE